jgi:hypothetical protein
VSTAAPLGGTVGFSENFDGCSVPRGELFFLFEKRDRVVYREAGHLPPGFFVGSPSSALTGSHPLSGDAIRLFVGHRHARWPGKVNNFEAFDARTRT